MSDSFSVLEERAVIELVLTDRAVLCGSYTTRAGLHFLHRTGPGLPLIGEVSGPYTEAGVRSVTVLKTRAEVLEEARYALHGEAVAGRDPVTREDFQRRLETIARAIVATDDWRREMQLRPQFDQVAARIQLARGKRAWMIAEAKWSRRLNTPPTMADLWVDPVASPSHTFRRNAIGAAKHGSEVIPPFA